MRHRGMSRKRGTSKFHSEGCRASTNRFCLSSVLCPCRWLYITILLWVCQGYFYIFLEILPKVYHDICLLYTKHHQRLLKSLNNLHESPFSPYIRAIYPSIANTNPVISTKNLPTSYSFIQQIPRDKPEGSPQGINKKFSKFNYKCFQQLIQGLLIPSTHSLPGRMHGQERHAYVHGTHRNQCRGNRAKG